jgi:nitrate/nitrite transporter NarK
MKRAAVATGLIGGVWAFVSSVVFPGMSSLGAKIGWRNAIFILVPIFAVIGIVSCLFLIRDTPEQKGLRVDGLSDEELKKIKAGRTGEAKEEANMTLRQALRTPQLWMLGIAYGLTLDDLGVMQGQSTIMATTYGIPIALAGMAMSALMIPAIFSRIGVGFLGDRYGRRRVLIYSSAGAALINIGGCFMVHNQTTLLVFLTSLGLFMMAGMTLTAPICGDLFGRKNIATIWGFCAGLAALISGVVSYTAGVIRTATGTYNLVYLILGAGFIIQVVIVLCRRPTKVERDNLQGQRL